MSRQELMKNSELLIIAGSETTATLLSGLTYLLLKTPHAYAKVQEEVRSAFISAEEITLTSTGQLPYLQACLEEAMRMYPPVPIALPRRTQPEGAMIGGHFVPGNVPLPPSQKHLVWLEILANFDEIDFSSSRSTCNILLQE